MREIFPITDEQVEWVARRTLPQSLLGRPDNPGALWPVVDMCIARIRWDKEKIQRLTETMRALVDRFDGPGHDHETTGLLAFAESLVAVETVGCSDG